MEPIFTNDAVVLGILLVALAAIFHTSHLESNGWKKFYRFVPALLLCYFIPAILHYPFGLIASEWFDNSLLENIDKLGLVLSEGMQFDSVRSFLEGASFPEIEKFLEHNGISEKVIK